MYIPFVSTVVPTGEPYAGFPGPVQSRRFDRSAAVGSIGDMIAMPLTIEGKQFLTVPDAVERMGCTDGWIRMLIRTGRLPAQKINARCWLIPVEAADAAKATLTSRSVGRRHLAERPAASRKPTSKRRKPTRRR